MTTKERLETTMDIEDVARVAKCSTRYVHEEVAKKNLRGQKVGRKWLFFLEDVEKWIKRKAVS